MIRFHLKCDKDHQFDSWFASNDAFDSLAKAGMLNCAICGSVTVSKTLMAPNVQVTDATAAPRPLIDPVNDTETKIAAIRDDVEKNSDYVGPSFANEARAMHDGDIPERAIHGTANGAEALKLVQDGVPIMPLPFVPTKKVN